MNEETGERATIVDGCGATLQALQLKSHTGEPLDVIQGHETPESLRERGPLAGSVPLIPWANRVHRARYRFLGREYLLPVNTGEGNAIHGFLFDKPWRVTSGRSTSNAACLTCEYVLRERGLPGYPFKLLARIDFQLSSDGFRTVTTVMNIGRVKLPLTVGFHPYLKAGPTKDGKIDSCRLTIPAAKRLEFREMIPTGRLKPVEGTAYDFRTPRLIGETRFDDGFTALSYSDGIASVKLYNETLGFGVELWQDRAYGFLQVYTPPHRQSVAVEPMSGAADAFNNGMGLIILEPGATFKAAYGLRPLR
ncbi:MAG: hypothetical protein QW587_05395 [Candidatus Bathyarchaeia archaeon]